MGFSLSQVFSRLDDSTLHRVQHRGALEGSRQPTGEHCASRCRHNGKANMMLMCAGPCT